MPFRERVEIYFARFNSAVLRPATVNLVARITGFVSRPGGHNDVQYSSPNNIARFPCPQCAMVGNITSEVTIAENRTPISGDNEYNIGSYGRSFRCHLWSYN